MTEPRPNFGNIAQQALLGLGALGAPIGTVALFDQTLNRVLENSPNPEIGAMPLGWTPHF